MVRISVDYDCSSDVNSVPKRTVALVLGTTSKQANGKPNPYFTYRMDAAAELYHNDKAELVLVSGFADGYYDETADMTRALIERGIPESKIKADSKGSRTLDSVVRAHELFKLNSFTIVSQPFHNHRALYICRERGIDASGFNAKSVTESKLWIHNLIREHLARVKMAADLFLFDTAPKSMEASADS